MDREQEIIDELKTQTRLLALIATKELRQSEKILILGEAGLAVTTIARLVGTTPNTVSVTLHRRKKKHDK